MSVDHTALASEVDATLAAINAGITSIGTLTAATPAVMMPVVTIVDNGVDDLTTQIDALDADIVTDSFAGIVGGLIAPDLWRILIEQAADSAQLANLLTTRAYVGRVMTNLAIAPP